MHEEIAYNSRIREEYELSFNNGSSAKITPCPWANFASKTEWERSRLSYISSYVIHDDRSKDFFLKELKRFELDRKWDMEISERRKAAIVYDGDWICENGTCYPAPTVDDRAPSLSIVPSNTAKGFSFKEPSVKLPETVDTNYSGKSVLTCLLELHRDLLFAVVKDLKADGKWFKLLFQSAADLRSALTAIVWAINTDVVRREVIDVVHSIDGGNFPEEPLYIPYREEQFVQPIIR